MMVSVSNAPNPSDGIRVVKGSIHLAVRESSLTLAFLNLGENEGSYKGWKLK